MSGFCVELLMFLYFWLYKCVVMEFDGCFVVIYGLNGVGKINVLEVILFLLFGCGFWCGVVEEMVC